MNDLQVLRARLPAHPDARTSLPLRLGSALDPLAGADDILLLRRLSARLSRADWQRPPWQTAGGWSELRAQATAARADARLPWRESVTSSTAAVRFEDPAQMLACAARDWLEGHLAAWWWDCLASRDAAGIKQLWTRHPHHLGRAWMLLAERGLAEAFADRLGRHLPELVEAWARVGSAGPLPVSTSAGRPPQTTTTDTTRRAKPVSDDLPVHHVHAPAPGANLPRLPRPDQPEDTNLQWTSPPPTEGSGARVETAQVTTPAANHRETRGKPALATGPSPTAARWRSLLSEHGGAISAQLTAQLTSPARPAWRSARLMQAMAVAGQDRPGTRTKSRGHSAPRRPRFGQPNPGLTSESSFLARTQPLPAAAARRDVHLQNDLVLAVPLPSTLPPSATVVATAHRYTPAEAVDGSITTAYGGLFHLLNLAQALGLYSDFSAPLRPGLPLSPWDFLALAGRALLGPALLEDPLWDWLARQAGRPDGVAPGSWAPPPAADWRLPRVWLKPWPQRGARLRVGASRHAWWHPAGFCLADLPGGRRGSKRVAQRGLPAPITDWSAWMARLAPFLAARLGRATGLPAGQAVASVLARPACLRQSGIRIRVHMPLANLPVRLAGLDRDLGWLPAAGCELYYVFEAEAP